MSRPISVIRGLVMLSMVFALMSAFTPNASAQAAGEVIITVNDDTGAPVEGATVDVAGGTAATGTCTTDATGACTVLFTAAPVDGETLTGTATDPATTASGTGTVVYDSTAVNPLDIVLAAPPVVVTGEITITKTDEAGTPLAGAEFTATDATGVVLATATTDVAGSATLSTGAATGDVVTLTETIVPAGCTADTPTKDVTITTGANLVDFVNTCAVVPPAPVGGSLVNVSVVISDDPALAGTSEYIVSGPLTSAAVAPGAGVTVTFTNDATADVITGVTDANGFVQVTLPAGTYTITNSAAPGAGTITVDGVAEYDLLIIAYPAVAAPAGAGAVDIEKLVCTETVDNVAGTVDIFVPGEFTAAQAPAECRAAVADEYTFTLFNNDTLYSGGEIVAIDTAATDATGQALLTADIDPTIGTRTVFVSEDLTGAESIDLVLTPDMTAEVLIINYVADVGTVPTPAPGATGDVEIAKLYCTDEDLAGKVEFEVLGPEFAVEATDVTAQAGTVEADNCSPGAAEFEIFPFGDKTAEPILVTVGSDGLIVIDGIIPVTTDLSPHKLLEVSTGAETFFDVAEGAVTKIITINYVGSDTGNDDKDTGGDTDTGGDNKDTGDNTGTTGGDTASKDTSGGTTTTTGGGSATTLPDTGAGAGQSADYGMAFFLVLGGLAAAGVSLRRRAA